MPISFIPIAEEDCWSGTTWTVDDEDKLAELVARVAIGQARVVERTLRATDALAQGYPKGGFEGARELLSVKSGQDTYHRDGWVFQVISWVAAHLSYRNAQIRAPQMLKADKGLDGLLIEFANDELARVVICEEKATEHPRQKIQSAVWPEFEIFEAGARDNELVASITSLLERSNCSDPDSVVANILWQDKRAYRVSVTVGKGHSTVAGRKRLFEHYDEKVHGNISRRRAETLYLADMRGWIAAISEKAILAIDTAEENNDV
ncbi:hypothetical protein [Raoultella terrigena]|uniref:hypothetical protein n=1 Tax=Raoultella terrigena TaxID=577 RepID=UPI0009763D29|nr:hypothetical protein [Raoultella terrigena]OMP95552.1 hypothetical protein BZP36_07200 [Raoultella terrigena]